MREEKQKQGLYNDLYHYWSGWNTCAFIPMYGNYFLVVILSIYNSKLEKRTLSFSFSAKLLLPAVVQSTRQWKGEEKRKWLQKNNDKQQRNSNAQTNGEKKQQVKSEEVCCVSFHFLLARFPSSLPENVCPIFVAVIPHHHWPHTHHHQSAKRITTKNVIIKRGNTSSTHLFLLLLLR